MFSCSERCLKQQFFLHNVVLFCSCGCHGMMWRQWRSFWTSLLPLFCMPALSTASRPYRSGWTLKYQSHQLWGRMHLGRALSSGACEQASEQASLPLLKMHLNLRCRIEPAESRLAGILPSLQHARRTISATQAYAHLLQHALLLQYGKSQCAGGHHMLICCQQACPCTLLPSAA